VRAVALLMAAGLAASASAQEAPAVRLYAAGSLRAPMTEIGQAFVMEGGAKVVATFGASGLLRERIEKGEQADVFASADIGNPATLAGAGRSAPPVVFARNRLCALVAPGVSATSETLLERMLDPSVKVGTSTPKADPSGDYAWQLFEKAEKLRPGAYATLDRKALKLVGGPGSPEPPAGRTIYGVMIAEKKADIFLTYCTNALLAATEVPGARMLTIPEPLAVGASYALTVMNGAPPQASRFALFVLSLRGQKMLEQYGFTAVAAP
jgi:ABC-type molybdate transport system substrate-binding protein